MKKILSVLIILFLSIILIPSVRAEENLYVLKIYEVKNQDDITPIQQASYSFMLQANVFTQNRVDDYHGYMTYKGKTTFYYAFNPETRKEEYTIAEGITYKDNDVYMFTTEDKELINTDDNFALLREYDGIKAIFEEECNDNEICIVHYNVEEKTSGVIIKNDPVVNNLSISFDVQLQNVNDLVKYKVIIQNKTKEEYKLNIKNFKDSKYLKYSYSFADGSSTIKANSDKTVYITIKYNREVPETVLENGFTEENEIIFSTRDDIINPKTGQRNLVIVLVLAIVALGVTYSLINKKQDRISLSILLLAVLLPIGIKALTELTITVNTKVEISSGSVMESRYNEHILHDMVITHSDYNAVVLPEIEKDFWQYYQYIKTITFNNKIEEPSTYEYKFDVSEAKDNSIIAYLVKNSTDNTLYDLYIMSNGIIYANPYCNFMFADMEKLDTINGFEYFNTSRATDMSFMFYRVINMETLDLRHFNTSNVTNMNSMFSTNTYTTKQAHIYLSSFDTSKVTDMAYMFYDLHLLEELDVSNFNTSKVTDMKYMFYAVQGNVTTLDLSNFDTRNVTDMSYMFQFCSFKTLDISNFNTSKVTSMSRMFEHCSSLEALDLSHFDTKNVTDMKNMFHYCHSLTTLNLSGFNTSKITDMSSMFSRCVNLKSLDLSSFDTKNVTTMRFMFEHTYALENLDLSSFDTSNVTDMSYMFDDSKIITTIDLSSFDTRNVTNTSGMFRFCDELTTIIVGSNWSNASITNSEGMFSYSYKIKGGNGTTYRNNYTDVTYARIDTPETPGYFTLKQ